MFSSKQQKQIYHTTSTRISASAGTGKTYQLASRFIALLMLSVEPDKIIALTFTKKAAGEFRSRILHALAEGACDLRDKETGRNVLAARIWEVWSGLTQPDRSSWAKAANDTPLLPATVAIVKLAASQNKYAEELYAAPEGKELRDYLQLPEQNATEFAELLRKVVKIMNKLELSTIDSFFNSLVAGNCLELGVNNVASLDPADEKSARLATIHSYLDARAAEQQKRAEFLDMFAGLTGGKGSKTVSKLERELANYLSLYREHPNAECWGNTESFAQDIALVNPPLTEEQANKWNADARQLQCMLSLFADNDLPRFIYSGLKNLAQQKTPLSKTVIEWIGDEFDLESNTQLNTHALKLTEAYYTQSDFSPQLQKQAASAKELLEVNKSYSKNDKKALTAIINALEKQDFKKTPKYIDNFRNSLSNKAIHAEEELITLRKIHALAKELEVDLPAKCLHDAITRTRSLYSLLRDYADAYEQRITATGEFSFDDIARKAYELMTDTLSTESAEASAFCREHLALRTGKKYNHWMLDEFQDTSDKQFDTLAPVLEMVLGESPVAFTQESPRPLPACLRPYHEDCAYYVADGSLFVVGDDKQGIYGFRTGENQAFDKLQTDPTWNVPIKEAKLTKSYRSSPDIMGKDGFVNDLFTKLNELEQQDSPTSAVNLESFTYHETARDFRGYVEMQVIAKEKETDDESEEATLKTGMFNAVSNILRKLTRDEEAPLHSMSIGILTRTNSEAEALVDHLRNDMPKLPIMLVKDTLTATACPLGEMLHHLFRWLQHPQEQTSCNIVKATFMSYLFEGEHNSNAVWHKLRDKLDTHGYTQLLQDIFNHFPMHAMNTKQQGAHKEVMTTWLNAAQAFDAAGGALSAWLRRISTLSTQGVASSRYVQVMTMHKSKGLEFDAVILPLMSDDAIDSVSDLSYFCSADGKSLLLSPGNSETRNAYWPGAFDELTTAWKHRCSKEAYNLLYVATTRAKYANYILLNGDKLIEEEQLLARSRSESGILRRAFGGTLEAYDATTLLTDPQGIETWYEALKPKNICTGAVQSTQGPGIAVQRRQRISPSTLAKVEDKQQSEADESPARTPYISTNAADFGTAVHECWEQITWLDAPLPEWAEAPKTKAQQVVAAALQQPEVRELFTRTSGVEVYCEQSIEAITKADEWVSGTIDRLVLTTDAAGRTIGAHIIDFKTNKLKGKEPYQELKKEYTSQMTAYKQLISQAFDLPAAAVKVSLLSCPKGNIPARVLPYTDEELPI
ncbi:MAG: UvrD-helicase domain-containing protein [Akkermansia sp.]|nr:UvrD-helicase domain-containing protein [Akkermansia sp.]